MNSLTMDKLHAVCIPFPAQGHITPMLKLAQLLHSNDFHITFVNTEHNHRRLLNSKGPSSLDGLPDFRFEAIPDGLPPTNLNVTQDIRSLCHAISTKCLAPFQNLISKLNHPNSGVPPITCIVSDLSMTFTLDAAEELGVPEVLLWTASACGFLAYFHCRDLIQRGVIPLKDTNQLRNREFMERTVEGIPGLEGIRFKDFPSFVRTTDQDDFILSFVQLILLRACRASAIVLNTFEELELPILNVLATKFPPIYTLGPFSLLSTTIRPTAAAVMGSNLWKEDRSCLEWLEGKPDDSVVYVNFGSITVMTHQQLVEFAWGLAGSSNHFLWVIRPDLLQGDSVSLPEEFVEETKERGLLVSWCPQEEVLRHPAVGGFLTHCGWNSTLESICAGVPMVCWPFFAEQQINCWYSCKEWGIGMEIDSDVKRVEVEGLIRELMSGEKGMVMRSNALKWKQRATAAASLNGGSSLANLDRLMHDVL